MSSAFAPLLFSAFLAPLVLFAFLDPAFVVFAASRIQESTVAVFILGNGNMRQSAIAPWASKRARKRVRAQPRRAAVDLVGEAREASPASRRAAAARSWAMPGQREARKPALPP